MEDAKLFRSFYIAHPLGDDQYTCETRWPRVYPISLIFQWQHVTFLIQRLEGAFLCSIQWSLNYKWVLLVMAGHKLRIVQVVGSSWIEPTKRIMLLFTLISLPKFAYRQVKVMRLSSRERARRNGQRTTRVSITSIWKFSEIRLSPSICNHNLPALPLPRGRHRERLKVESSITAKDAT